MFQAKYIEVGATTNFRKIPYQDIQAKGVAPINSTVAGK